MRRFKFGSDTRHIRRLHHPRLKKSKLIHLPKTLTNHYTNFTQVYIFSISTFVNVNVQNCACTFIHSQCFISCVSIDEAHYFPFCILLPPFNEWQQLMLTTKSVVNWAYTKIQRKNWSICCAVLEIPAKIQPENAK